MLLCPLDSRSNVNARGTHIIKDVAFEQNEHFHSFIACSFFHSNILHIKQENHTDVAQDMATSHTHGVR